jgi:hypothetical protein
MSRTKKLSSQISIRLEEDVKASLEQMAAGRRQIAVFANQSDPAAIRSGAVRRLFFGDLEEAEAEELTSV